MFRCTMYLCISVMVLGAWTASAGAAEFIVNGGFESWDGSQSVDHDNSGSTGIYNGQSTSQWNGAWADLKAYSSVQENVQWVRMEQRNLEPGGNVTMVAPLATEGSGSFVNNNYLPSEGVEGWSVYGNIDVKSSYWETQDTGGGFDTPVDDRISLDLSCTRGGGVQQTFSYTPGQTLTVQFDMSANMYGGRSPRPMLVQLGAGSKSAYTDDGGSDNGVYGNFVAADLLSYSNVRVWDGSQWQSLTDNGGSAGTRVAYTAIDVDDSDATSQAAINDGWGGSLNLGPSLQARDADGLNPSANVGLEGLVFLFDRSGSKSGLGAISNVNTDWTTVAFDITVDESWFVNGELPEALTLSFMSLEGDIGSASNHGPALDDVSVTPEPASMALLACGGLGLLARRRKRRA